LRAHTPTIARPPPLPHTHCLPPCTHAYSSNSSPPPFTVQHSAQESKTADAAAQKALEAVMALSKSAEDKDKRRSRDRSRSRDRDRSRDRRSSRDRSPRDRSRDRRDRSRSPRDRSRDMGRRRSPPRGPPVRLCFVFMSHPRTTCVCRALRSALQPVSQQHIAQSGTLTRLPFLPTCRLVGSVV
jgi:hypothetical protein